MFVFNSSFAPGAPLEIRDARALGLRAAEEAARVLSSCPRYAPTPLVALPALALELGIGRLHVKDESERLGLGSFKALGGAFAVIDLVLSAAREELGRSLAPTDLRTPEVRAVARDMVVACATDGNHGRSVAAGARLAGCRAEIFVHEGVSTRRVAAIAELGAHIVRVPGVYDDAVAQALRVSAQCGWHIVSDTSWPGHEQNALKVMQGYTVLLRETLESLEVCPTHVFVQAGVGGLAAAVAAHFSAVLGDSAPLLVVVEPGRAACLLASHRAGRCLAIRRNEPTVMAMLECYEPSLVAWRILQSKAAAFMTIDEDEAIAAMLRLARPSGRDRPIVAGESGGAGLAGLIRVAQTADVRARLKLDSSACVLVFNTEGATDPALYAQLTGLEAQTVIGAASPITA